ncbi:MAG TPA: hypothetical protein P5202_05050, partial [Methanomassiliicoccales archaeon]|nr:hypothetical protein [Methanomassiliicoccales archaeon]
MADMQRQGEQQAAMEQQAQAMEVQRQAILRQRGQPAFEEGELVLAQAADVTRLLARQQDHVVEDRNPRPAGSRGGSHG